MKLNPIPNAPSEAKYSGPGWHEWIYGLLVTGIAVVEVSARNNFTTAQSNYNYYAEIPGIQFIHNCAMFTTFGILATLTFWIAFPKFAHQCRIVVASLSVLGFGLVWVELIRAVTIRDPRFLLSELPLHPINNWGFVGSSVFAAYLIFKLPSGMLKTVPTILLKAAFALSLFAIQFIFFESVGIRPL